MSIQRPSTETMWDSVQVGVTQLVREPVKDAVREALREEAATVTTTSGETRASSEDSDATVESGGRSTMAWVGAALALGGIAYLARRRLSSGETTWSEPSQGAVAADDAESGYTSEGEMQTAETADDSIDSAASPSSPADQ